MAYTSYLLKQRGKHRRFDPDTRTELAFRFKALYRNLGLDLAGCAKLLHVTERTLHNWDSGKHDIPYSAYRLLRLLNRMELPGESWSGWCFHSGKLWTPEGRSFVGTDGSWWSLLVRRAACFDTMFKRSGQFEQALMALAAERRDGDVASLRAADVAGSAASREAGPVGGGPACGEVPAGAGERREAPEPNLLIVHFPTQQHVFGANAASYAINPVAKTTYSLVAANNSSVKGVA